MFVRALATIVILISLHFSAYAENGELKLSNEDRTNVEEISLKFARCSAVYETVSTIHAATGSSALSESTKQTSNGALIASAFLISSMGVISDWKKALTYAEETSYTEKTRWKATLEQANANDVIGQLTDEMKICNKMGEYQEKLVQDARLWAYSQGSKEK